MSAQAVKKVCMYTALLQSDTLYFVKGVMYWIHVVALQMFLWVR